MHGIYAHARFDGPDRGARSQWVGKGKTNQHWVISTHKQAISIKLATTVGLFFFFFKWPSLWNHYHDYGLTIFSLLLFLLLSQYPSQFQRCCPHAARPNTPTPPRSILHRGSAAKGPNEETSGFFFRIVGRPDMTFAVDWALSNNYLSIYPYSGHSQQADYSATF